MSRHGLGSLGVYPTEIACDPNRSWLSKALDAIDPLDRCDVSVCFDPQRPAWMPYWMDTAAESLCKSQKIGLYPGAGRPPVASGPPPLAPQTPGQMVDPGAWTPDDSVPGPDDWLARIRYVLDDYDPYGDREDSSAGLLLLAAGGLGLLLLWPEIAKFSKKGRRR